MLDLRLRYRIAGIVILICMLGIIVLGGCSQPAATATPAPSSTVTASISTVPTSTAGSTINSTPASIPASTPVSPAPTPEGYFVAVIINNTMIAALTRADLEKLEKVSVMASGIPQNGPTLPSVLQKAGITDFSELTAYGMTRGRLASAELTLKKDQVDASVVLDLNNRGKCKLCGVNIPQDNWIIDLEKLEVK
jgi:hypothetical protein